MNLGLRLYTKELLLGESHTRKTVYTSSDLPIYGRVCQVSSFSFDVLSLFDES